MKIIIKSLHDLQEQSAKRAIFNLKKIRIKKQINQQINAILKDAQSSRLEKTS